jgi:hypothetical protein
MRSVGHRRHHQFKRFAFRIAGWRSGLTELIGIAVKTLLAAAEVLFRCGREWH